MATIETNGRLNGSSHASEQLLDRLNEPRTQAALNQLLDHAELLAFSAASLDGLLRRGDVIADNVASSVSEIRHSLPSAPLPDTAQLAELLQNLPRLITVTNQLAALTEKPEFQATLALLSNPATLDSLNKLLGQAELLSFLVGALDSLLQRGETIADNLRASMQELSVAVPEGGANLVSLLEAVHAQRALLPRLVYTLPQFTEIVERLGPFVASQEFSALLESGVFHADTVTLVGQGGDSFVESYNEFAKSPQRLGPVGLLKALSDPDVQRVMALLVDFSKRFGKTLSK